ncbi:MAG TPA: DUF1549 domain-containing protein, partial [Pirellula sp.]|nr:DUF1549 domain-containing protein [Pirellula sp.]
MSPIQLLPLANHQADNVECLPRVARRPVPFFLARSFELHLAIVFVFVFAIANRAAERQLPPSIEFNRDVRPILADNCFSCHGNDANHREAELRLDVREDAMSKKAFVPGGPDESEMIRRIFATDADEVMPPPDSHKKMSDQQKGILRRWIEEGAAYQQHWSYEKPVKAAIPDGKNGVDVLVQRQLEEVGLKPAPEADRRTLIRRLYFDLIGLPPSPDEVAAFANDKAMDAYEKLVDRLVKNPHYGERMAIGWLDVVRYADTIGYHSDNPHNVWPYRDWVIKSFNNNKRFDRFTIEQIAGDLIPDANQETRIGSAFNRLLLTTQEGGAQPKDYEQRMLTDRVRAIGAVWMGQTTGCAQCHDHKFDPFTQRDFYSLGAFFADIDEKSVGLGEEGMTVTTQEQEAKLAKLDTAVSDAKKAVDAILPLLENAQEEWEAELIAQKVELPDLVRDSKSSEVEKKNAHEILALVTKSRTNRKAKESQQIQDYFRTKVSSPFKAELEAMAHAQIERKEFHSALPKCLVSKSASQK